VAQSQLTLAVGQSSDSHLRPHRGVTQTTGGPCAQRLVHHNAEAYLAAYLSAAQIAEDRKGPLFRSLDRERHLMERRLHRLEVLAMIKRRAR